jgi:hypothetical protein
MKVDGPAGSRPWGTHSNAQGLFYDDESSRIEDEEDEMYRSSSFRQATHKQTQLVSYQFTVCDSLLSISPVGDVTISRSLDISALSV